MYFCTLHVLHTVVRSQRPYGLLLLMHASGKKRVRVNTHTCVCNITNRTMYCSHSRLKLESLFNVEAYLDNSFWFMGRNILTFPLIILAGWTTTCVSVCLWPQTDRNSPFALCTLSQSTRSRGSRFPPRGLQKSISLYTPWLVC